MDNVIQFRPHQIRAYLDVLIDAEDYPDPVLRGHIQEALHPLLAHADELVPKHFSFSLKAPSAIPGNVIDGLMAQLEPQFHQAIREAQLPLVALVLRLQEKLSTLELSLHPSDPTNPGS